MRLEPGRTNLDDTLTDLEKRLAIDPENLDLQQQHFSLLSRTGKLKRCRGCGAYSQLETQNLRLFNDTTYEVKDMDLTFCDNCTEKAIPKNCTVMCPEPCPDCGDIGTLIEPHSCPYQADVNNDSETLCVCCSCSERQCAWDI